MKNMLWLILQLCHSFIFTNCEWIILPYVEPISKLSDKSAIRITSTQYPHTTKTNRNESSGEQLAELQEILLNVHQSLLAESSKPLHHKITFLIKLKDYLLHQMKSECRMMWENNFQGRSHGHIMSFPSIEGALLTMAFLTFAIFLIKIVKQFIQGVQANSVNNGATIDMQGLRLTPSKIIRHKRNTNYSVQMAATILQYINDFQMRHKG